ncbi:hypothetical protein [Effusibacillus consociatus]|uniref:Cell division protein FtsL n=1 Tax=Effusibacillus consociatus TaxID=1117041 RepID=A0ABV9Q8B1_9BACL
MLAARSVHGTTAAWGKQTEISRPSVQQTAVQKTSGERLKWMATILFCTIVLCGIIGQYSEIARTNIEVERLKIQMEEQMLVNAKLNDRVNELKSPGRIVSKAREIGMVSTNPGAVAKAGRE